MKQTLLLRIAFELSQYDLAQLLQTPRSVINMHERGERTLPTIALSRLAKLEDAWDKNPAADLKAEAVVNTSLPFFESQDIIAKLNQQVERLRLDLEIMDKDLYDMRTQYEMLECWARTLIRFRSEESVEDQERYEKWHNLHMLKVARRLDLVGPEKQYVLQHRTQLKRAMLKVNEEALEVLEKRLTPDDKWETLFGANSLGESR